jgi:hypothetical protein
MGRDYTIAENVLVRDLFNEARRAIKGRGTMDEPPTTPAPSRCYHSQVAQVLAHLERIVIDGLEHGFFDCSIECVKGDRRSRHLVIRASKSHKFTIREDELPR